MQPMTGRCGSCCPRRAAASTRTSSSAWTDASSRRGIGLAETKERIESDDSGIKSRTEHREYGRALMLTYDVERDRFLKVEYAAEVGRNREVGPLRPDDLF